MIENDFSLAQLLGFVSLGLGISVFYQKDDRRLKILMLVFNINHLLHYILLGSMISAFAAFLSALRTGISIYTASKQVAALFIIIAMGLGIYLAEHWWNLFPVLGTVIGTYAIFTQQGIKMRVCFLIGAFCWLTNNILVGSYGGILLEITVICMNSSTIFRLLRDKKRLHSTQAA